MFSWEIKEFIESRGGKIDCKDLECIINTSPQIRTVEAHIEINEPYPPKNGNKQSINNSIQKTKLGEIISEWYLIETYDYLNIRFQLYNLELEITEIIKKIKENQNTQNILKGNNYKKLNKILEMYLLNQRYITEETELKEYYEKLMNTFKNTLLFEKKILINSITSRWKNIIIEKTNCLNKLQKQLKKYFDNIDKNLLCVKSKDANVSLNKGQYKQWGKFHDDLMCFEGRIIELRKILAYIILPNMLNELLQKNLLSEEMQKLYFELQEKISIYEDQCEKRNYWLEKAKEGQVNYALDHGIPIEKINSNTLVHNYDDENKKHTQDYYALTYKT